MFTKEQRCTSLGCKVGYVYVNYGWINIGPMTRIKSLTVLLSRVSSIERGQRYTTWIVSHRRLRDNERRNEIEGNEEKCTEENKVSE